MNVTLAKQQEAGGTIATLTGKVDEVYKRNAGVGPKGPWTVQGLKLSEGNDWIKVDLWNHDELSAYKGHVIKISSDRGLQVQDNAYTDKAGVTKGAGTVKISCSKGAVITSPGFGDDGDAPQQTAPQAPHQVPPVAQAAPAHSGPGPNEPFVKRRQNQLANMYLLCNTAADYIYANPISAGLTPEHYQACVSTLFIQATREGLTDHIAIGKFHKAEQHQEQEPEPTPPHSYPPLPLPPPAPRTPANPQYGDHRDHGTAFDPTADIDDNIPF